MGFRDGEEDRGYLEDIVEVFFGPGPVFEQFVLVAGEFEALLACGGELVWDWSDLIAVSRWDGPFLSRTIDTFVNLI